MSKTSFKPKRVYSLLRDSYISRKLSRYGQFLFIMFEMNFGADLSLAMVSFKLPEKKRNLCIMHNLVIVVFYAQNCQILPVGFVYKVSTVSSLW